MNAFLLVVVVLVVVSVVVVVVVAVVVVPVVVVAATKLKLSPSCKDRSLSRHYAFFLYLLVRRIHNE